MSVVWPGRPLPSPGPGRAPFESPAFLPASRQAYRQEVEQPASPGPFNLWILRAAVDRRRGLSPPEVTRPPGSWPPEVGKRCMRCRFRGPVAGGGAGWGSTVG